MTKAKGDELEEEMGYIFDKPEKHTWREGYVDFFIFNQMDFLDSICYTVVILKAGW